MSDLFHYLTTQTELRRFKRISPSSLYHLGRCMHYQYWHKFLRTLNKSFPPSVWNFRIQCRNIWRSDFAWSSLLQQLLHVAQVSLLIPVKQNNMIIWFTTQREEVKENFLMVKNNDGFKEAFAGFFYEMFNVQILNWKFKKLHYL